MELLGRGWLSCGRRKDTEPGGAAARVGAAGPRLAFREAGARPQSPSRGAAARVGAAGPRLSCGKRKTQSLLEELLRAWAPLGRGFRVASARHRAF